MLIDIVNSKKIDTVIKPIHRSDNNYYLYLEELKKYVRDQKNIEIEIYHKRKEKEGKKYKIYIADAFVPNELATTLAITTNYFDSLEQALKSVIKERF